MIDSITIEKLFGHYTYNLPEEGNLRNPAILYGDNGVGKSTILLLVFHLLSAGNGRGHRTALRQANFGTLTVRLSSGHLLTASHPEGPSDEILVLNIHKGDEHLAEWIYTGQKNDPLFEMDPKLLDSLMKDETTQRLMPEEIRFAFRSRALRSKNRNILRGEKEYMGLLSKISPEIYLLNSDRRLVSDMAKESEVDFVEARNLVTRGNFKSINEIIRPARIKSLQQAMQKAAQWLRRLAVAGTNQGSTNVHSIYEDILSRITRETPLILGNETTGDVDRLIRDVEQAEERTRAFAVYELTSIASAKHFIAALRMESGEAARITPSLIDPYVKSLIGKLDALEPVFQTIDTFVKTINGFLINKQLKFTLSQGFVIVTNEGVDLQPESLSSGEEQLLLMFCNVLTARERPSVFIIDEPEISLNVKWQRVLLRSLLEVAGDRNIQFLIASHSHEIISQYISDVVRVGTVHGN